MVEFLPLILGIGGLFYAYHIYNKVKEYPEGNERVREIGDQIHLGAMVFMRTEYRMLMWFAGVVTVFLLIVIGFWTAVAFVVGALWALLNASSLAEQIIGFTGVLLGAGNAAGGYVVTERMLQMFKPSNKPGKE